MSKHLDNSVFLTLTGFWNEPNPNFQIPPVGRKIVIKDTILVHKVILGGGLLFIITITSFDCLFLCSGLEEDFVRVK